MFLAWGKRIFFPFYLSRFSKRTQIAKRRSIFSVFFFRLLLSSRFPLCARAHRRDGIRIGPANARSENFAHSPAGRLRCRTFRTSTRDVSSFEKVSYARGHMVTTDRTRESTWKSTTTTAPCRYNNIINNNNN